MGLHPNVLDLWGGQVLPMTTSFGMIEWVPNTRVLKEMISDGLKDASTKARSQSTSRRSSSSSSQVQLR